MALFTVHRSLVLSKMNPLRSDLHVHSMESPSHCPSGRWSDGSCLITASNDPRAGLLPPRISREESALPLSSSLLLPLSLHHSTRLTIKGKMSLGGPPGGPGNTVIRAAPGLAQLSIEPGVSWGRPPPTGLHQRALPAPQRCDLQMIDTTARACLEPRGLPHPWGCR